MLTCYTVTKELPVIKEEKLSGQKQLQKSAMLLKRTQYLAKPKVRISDDVAMLSFLLLGRSKVKLEVKGVI